MRRGFALLEVLVALVVFSILILGSSKILLELTKSKIAYSKFQLRQLEVQNAILIIKKYLKYSPSIIYSPNTITFYPLNLSYFFSPTFSPLPTQCKGERIKFYPSSFVYSVSDKKVVKVLENQGGEMRLERSVSCGLFYPLSPQITLSLSPQGELKLNEEILLKDVKVFEVQESAIKLCDCQISKEEIE